MRIFFDKIEEFNKKINIPSRPELYPIKKENKFYLPSRFGKTIKKRYDLRKPLTKVYKDLIEEMENMPFIKIIK